MESSPLLLLLAVTAAVAVVVVVVPLEVVVGLLLSEVELSIHSANPVPSAMARLLKEGDFR